MSKPNFKRYMASVQARKTSWPVMLMSGDMAKGNLRCVIVQANGGMGVVHRDSDAQSLAKSPEVLAMRWHSLDLNGALALPNGLPAITEF